MTTSFMTWCFSLSSSLLSSKISWGNVCWHPMARNRPSSLIFLANSIHLVLWLKSSTLTLSASSSRNASLAFLSAIFLCLLRSSASVFSSWTITSLKTLLAEYHSSQINSMLMKNTGVLGPHPKDPSLALGESATSHPTSNTKKITKVCRKAAAHSNPHQSASFHSPRPM